MESIWDLYTSKREYDFAIKDKFDRSLINYTRDGKMHIPTVSNYLVEKGFKPKYPNNKKFATCISHDIDNLFKGSNKVQLLKSIVKGNFKKIKKELNQNFKREIDEGFDLKNIKGINEKFGVKSSYYFLSVEEDDKDDFNYAIKEIEHYFADLKSSGNEVGLHGSRKAYNSVQKLEIEKGGLEKFASNIRGYRNHFLKFEIPTTWNVLAEAGIKYDTTFGAASCPGFRNGMCFPFQPFDLNTGKWIDIYEIPLIAMDVSFFRYLGLDYKTAFELFKLLVNKVIECNGVFTFLWHNNYVQGDMKAFYEKCLQYLSDMDTWFATGDEVIDWWQENDYFAQQKQLLNTIKI